MRLIDADLAQQIADIEMSVEDAGKIQWVLSHTLTIDAKVEKHGRWHDVYMNSPSSFAGTCSVCGVSNDIPHPYSAHYCPNCGAKMDLR